MSNTMYNYVDVQKIKKQLNEAFEVGTEAYLKHGIKMTPGQDKDPRKDPLLTYADLKKENLLGQKSNSKKKSSKRKKQTQTQTEEYNYELYQRFIEEKILTEQDLVADVFRKTFPWVAKGAGALLALGILGAFYGLKVAKNKMIEKPRIYLKNSDDVIKQMFAMQEIIAKFTPSSGGWSSNMSRQRTDADKFLSDKVFGVINTRTAVAAYTHADAMVLSGAVKLLEKKTKELAEQEGQQQQQQAAPEEGQEQGQEQTAAPTDQQQPTTPEKTLQQNSFTYDHYKKLIQEQTPQQTEQEPEGTTENPAPQSTETPSGEGQGVANQPVVETTVTKQEMQSWLTEEWLSDKEYQKYSKENTAEIESTIKEFQKNIQESIDLILGGNLIIENKPFESEFLNTKLDLILEAKLKDSEIEELSKKQPKWVRDFLKATKKQFGANAFRKAAEENKLKEFVVDRSEKNPTNFDKWKDAYVKKNQEEGKRIAEFLKKYRKENEEILSKLNDKEEDEEESAEETPEENSSEDKNPDDVEIEEIEDEPEVEANENEEEKEDDDEKVKAAIQKLINRKKALLQKETQKFQENYSKNALDEIYKARVERFLNAFQDITLSNEKSAPAKTKAMIEGLVKKSLTDTFVAETENFLSGLGFKVGQDPINKVLQNQNILEFSDSLIKKVFEILYKNNEKVSPDDKKADYKRFHSCASGKECHLKPSKQSAATVETEKLKAGLETINKQLALAKADYTKTREKVDRLTDEFPNATPERKKEIKDNLGILEKKLSRRKEVFNDLKGMKNKAKEALKAEKEKRKGLIDTLFSAENVENLKDNIKTDVLDKIGGAFGIPIGTMGVKRVAT